MCKIILHLINIGFLLSRFRGESFPLVVIECLKSGKPVLATDKVETAKMLLVQSLDAELHFH